MMIAYSARLDVCNMCAVQLWRTGKSVARSFQQHT